MNKRIFFKLGLVLLSLSLVACGQKNNSEDNNHEDMHQDIQSNIEQYTQEESTEDEYYTIIKDAWQKQKDYIKSIEDSKVKQSVQTSRSAAIMEANRLLIEHPEDSDAEKGSKVKAYLMTVEYKGKEYIYLDDDTSVSNSDIMYIKSLE